MPIRYRSVYAQSCMGANRFLGLPLYAYIAPRIMSSAIVGSSSVEVSPRLAVSPSAILRKMRRIILPERVLGKPRTN